jgi:hypothetical protein
LLLFLRRPLRIVTAYVCAAFTAGLMLAAVVVAQLPDHSMREVLPGLLGAGLALTRVAAIVGFIPAIVVIAVSEWRSERRWWAYSISTACFSTAAAAIISEALTMPIDALNAVVTLGGSAVLGAVSGWVYWRVAGRFAGSDRLSGRG